jgi:hypothetical protein
MTWYALLVCLKVKIKELAAKNSIFENFKNDARTNFHLKFFHPVATILLAYIQQKISERFKFQHSVQIVQSRVARYFMVPTTYQNRKNIPNSNNM